MKSKRYILPLLLWFIFLGCGKNPKTAESNENQKPSKMVVDSVSETTEDHISRKDLMATPDNDEMLNKESDAVSADKRDGITEEGTNEPTKTANTTDSNKEEEQSQKEIKNDQEAKKDTEPENVETVELKPSYEIWDQWMKKYVTSNGQVNYQGLKSEEKEIDGYLNELIIHVPNSNWSTNEKLSFWINVYNAFTISLILDHYPVKSITDIHNGKPWDFAFVDVGANKLTLNQIENEIIRPRFKEPRIHFALNCAALSCPKLLNEAYVPEKLDRQLNAQSAYFINNPNKNTINADQIAISKIFEWYGSDFSDIIAFFNQFSKTKIDDNAKVSFLEYDWQLNE
ncbi:DUF547 domain-containing protein [Fulvivirgaceae bacterium BMA10]|uniref:DUF547 domain-containing protein n=1 Tax=Splendidivirga corallicola TaxID=3051826 RepID=A0ABT8KWQ1_9BACT|nr:DUF547 domain-containing protein [Fulvivirgaceae bacterium BMA10]